MMSELSIIRDYVLAFLLLSVSDVSAYSLPATTTDGQGAILGRAIEIPANDYRLFFTVPPPTLGECPVRMEGKTIKTCKEKFGGDEVFIPYASTGVDVSRVQVVDDVITQGMGGIGVNVGALGLVSVGVKANAAVRTQTNNKCVTFMSSYEVKRGMLTLRNPRPLTDIGPDGALYLSEIELGGNEMLMVTMDFESVQKKIEVQVTVTVKILFFSISAKMRYVKEKFKTAQKTRILFVSSWRGTLDKTFTSLDEAIKEVERIEEMYVTGPAELSTYKHTDERLHNMYYFASWKKSIFGETNEVIAVNELAALTEQHTEVKAIIIQIDEYIRRMILDLNVKNAMEKLKADLTKMSVELSTGLENYYKLTSKERNSLFDIYGKDRAPGYYQRKLKGIIGY